MKKYLFLSFSIFISFSALMFPQSNYANDFFKNFLPKTWKYPLHHAVEKADYKKVKEILESNANVNERNNHGNTALHIASKKGDLEMIELLLSNGADINMKNDIDQTALHYAVYSKHKKATIFLVENGADVNVKNKYNHYPSSYIKRSRYVNNNYIDLIFWSPFYKAISEDDYKKVKELIENSTNINAQDIFGQTPLHYAVKYGRTKIAKLLLENNADINMRNRDGRTPVYFTSTTMLEFLSLNGVDINVRDAYGNTLLHYAAQKNNIKLVEYLFFKLGADISAKNNVNQTPYSIAILFLSFDTANFLAMAKVITHLSENKKEQNQLVRISCRCYDADIFNDDDLGRMIGVGADWREVAIIITEKCYKLGMATDPGEPGIYLQDCYSL